MRQPIVAAPAVRVHAGQRDQRFEACLAVGTVAIALQGALREAAAKLDFVKDPVSAGRRREPQAVLLAGQHQIVADGAPVHGRNEVLVLLAKPDHPLQFLGTAHVRRRRFSQYATWSCTWTSTTACGR